MSSLACFVALVFVCCLASSNCQDELKKYGELVLAIVTFRHGARAPISQCPGDLRFDVARDFPDGLAQLTQRGKDESFELGGYLRKRYDEFLPLMYQTDDTYVRSVTLDRNLVTAYLVMASLYPPLNSTSRREVFWQPVPVQTAPADCDLLLQSSTACPAHLTEQERVKMTDEFSCLQRKSQSMVTTIKENTENDDLSFIADCLITKSYQGLSLPDWTKELYPEPLLSYWTLNYFFLYSGTTKIQRLFSGLFVQEILNTLRQKIEGTLLPDRKLFAYSSRDINIYSVLNILGIHDAFMPLFSSCLFIELRNATQPREQYVITVSYRNGTSDPQPLKLPGCLTVACTFEEFSAIVQPVLPFSREECFNNSTDESDQPVILIHPTSVADYWKECFNNTATHQDGD